MRRHATFARHFLRLLPRLPCSAAPLRSQDAATAQTQQPQVVPVNPRQGPAPPPAPLPRGKNTIRSTVSLVEIDVQVTDRDGKPIKGLTQEQFSVSEDGKPQKVSTFEYNDIEQIETASSAAEAPITVPLGTVSAPEEIKAVVHDHRMIVLFFDMTSLQAEDLLRSTRAAEKYIREQMTPADLVGVVAFGNTLKVIANFTNNRELLQQSVEALVPGHEAALAQLADAATAANGEAAVTEDTGRRVHRGRHRVQRLQYRPQAGRRRSHLRSPGKHSREKIADSIHQRHHADGRGKPLGTDRRHQFGEPRQRFHLHGGFARPADGHAGRRRQRGRVGRHGHVQRRDRHFAEPVARGFPRNAGDACGRHRRAILFRYRRFRQDFSERAERYFGLLPGRLLQHGHGARRRVAQRPRKDRQAARRGPRAHARGLLRAEGFRHFHDGRPRAATGGSVPLGNSRGRAARGRRNRASSA